MRWEDVLLDRETLYKAVWAQPVSTVAKDYGISDVGLKKICKKLDVPTPPLGYWARIAAGQTPRITPLRANHQGPKTHALRIRIDDDAPERQRRTVSLLDQNRPSVLPTVVVPEDLDGCHQLVIRISKRLTTRSSDPAKMLSVSGRDVFAVHVSQAQRDRALRILQGCLDAFLSAGAALIPPKQDGDPLHLRILDQFVSLQIDELMDRTLREPTAKELAEQAKYSWVKLDLRIYTPNGRLKLTVLSDDGNCPFLSVSDGASPITNRLTDLVERVWQKAAEQNVRGQMQLEEHQRREKERARRKAREEVRQAELERLKETEKTVQQWHRARLLRDYAIALERHAPTSEGMEEVAWIRNAADWLDPIIARPWPEVEEQDDD